MKKITFLFFMAIILLSCTNSNTNKDLVINAKDFGLTEQADATPAILKALMECKSKGASKLIIPNGTYSFYPDKAFESWLAISNNDNGMKRIAFPIIGMENIEIDAQGSEFVYHGHMVPFEVTQSKNIKLTNFNIDWDKNFHLQGEVVAVDKENKTFDVKIAEDTKYEILGPLLVFYCGDRMHNIFQNIWFDPETKATVYRVSDYKMNPWMSELLGQYKAWEVGDRTVRVLDTIAKLPEIGWQWVIKGKDGTGKSRVSPAIHLNESEDITLQNINVYHASGMGLIAERSKNIAMKNFNIKLREGSDRIISTTADATHFVYCKGNITFDSCLFENMLDDATNVHGIYCPVVETINDYTLGVREVHNQQWGVLFAAAGDEISFVDQLTLETYHKAKVQSVQIINEEYMKITFTEKVADKLREPTMLENEDWYPDLVTMKNCTVRQNRARSILLTSPCKMVIEDNYFSSMMAAIAFHADGDFWYESGRVNDVTIRNNTFVNHATGGKGNSLFLIHPHIKDFSQLIGYFHSNITIEDNVIKNFDTRMLYALSVENFKFKNNTIIQTNDFAPISAKNASFTMEYSSNIEITGNTYEGNAEFTVSQENCKNVLIENNKGMFE